MRSQARIWFLTVVCGVLLAGLIPSAAQAAGTFGVEAFTATNCREGYEGCAGVSVPSGIEGAGGGEVPYWFPKEPEHAEAVTQGFTQAGGRVPYGVTDFKVNTEGTVPEAQPVGGAVSKVRVDVASGLATSPANVPTCSLEEFGETEVVPHTGLYTAPECEASTKIGVEKVTLDFGEELHEAIGIYDLPVEGAVYNLVQPKGLASFYGAAVALPKFLTEAKGLGKTQYYVHSFVEGSVEWGQEPEGTDAGDYHDYFTVHASTAFPLISSRQVLYGTSGNGAFITNATSCPGDNTTYVTIENEAKETARRSYTTPIGLKGCNLEHEDLEGVTEIAQVPFAPTFALTQGSALSDAPDEISTEVSLPDEPEGLEQSQVKTASITLPEGMTLDPSAAHGLEACTPAQARIHSATFGVECPVGSDLGTVSLEVPTLPAGSFTGHMYLGGPETGPITGSPYIVYVVANSARYGISVRVKGEVIPNPITGQITTVFQENPEQPFTNLTLHFNRGVLTSVANPLICGTPTGAAGFNPVIGSQAATSSAFGISVTGCAATIPFSLSQGTENEESKGGGHTSWTYSLSRPEGNQYLQEVKTTLPPGLVGNIPSVTLCGEPQAGKGECPAASKIGTVAVASGSGSSPYTFNGTVYMTGPYNGAPYGLSIVVPAIAGPFNLGPVVSRATININPSTAQVTSDAVLPTIVAGIPIRLRSLTVNINKQGFLDNPTNCETPLVTSSTLTSTEKATDGASSTFSVANCSALSFAPKFTATTSAKTSRANGASLTTTITQGAGQSNIKSVKVQLPRQLPSRLSTLNKACTEAVFNANPLACPKDSMVGTATVVTPTLPGKMTGPAIFVSHGGEAFPDLDLVVEDQGVRVILVGNTLIKNNITTTTFATAPDVPVTSVTVSLPTKSNSALAAYGDICRNPLYMPTTITGQNGKVTKKNTVIGVSGCGVKVVGHKVIGNTAYLTIKTFAAGRISGSGRGVSTVRRSLAAAHKAVTLKVPLSSGGRSSRKPLKVKIRVGFVPKKGAHSTTTVTVTYR